MKLKLLTLAAALGAAVMLNGSINQTTVPVPQLVTLAWDYPVTELSTNLVFNLYHRTSLPSSPGGWLLLTNVPGTNLCLCLPLLPGEHYFYLTASNFWGESDPSNVASTPPPPRSGVISIRRGK